MKLITTPSWLVYFVLKAQPFFINFGWFSLEFSVFLSEHVEVDGTPEASSLPPDDHDGGGVDWQEDPGAAAAVPRVFHSFARSGFK